MCGQYADDVLSYIYYTYIIGADVLSVRRDFVLSCELREQVPVRAVCGQYADATTRPYIRSGEYYINTIYGNTIFLVY